MSEVGKLTTELDALDDQISKCITTFEERLKDRVKISVRAPFKEGHIAWMKHNGVWRVVYEVHGTETVMVSSNRFTRMEAVRTGLALLLDQIVPVLQENIIERRLTLQAYMDLEKKLDEALK
jgi:hypothetical protein